MIWIKTQSGDLIYVNNIMKDEQQSTYTQSFCYGLFTNFNNSEHWIFKVDSSTEKRYVNKVFGEIVKALKNKDSFYEVPTEVSIDEDSKFEEGQEVWYILNCQVRSSTVLYVSRFFDELGDALSYELSNGNIIEEWFLFATKEEAELELEKELGEEEDV